MTIIGVIGDKTKLQDAPLDTIPSVDRIIPVTESYKLSNRKFHPENSIISVGKYNDWPLIT